MSNFDPNVLELLVAMVGTVAAVVGVVFQIKSTRTGTQNRQQEQALPKPPDHPKRSADGGPSQ